MLTFATVAIMATASAPSPIYPLYQERWHFSVTALTVVFAVYVAGLLGALLTVGSLSDHVGRRPVLIAAFNVAAISTALFWTADGPTTLIIARLVQGVASGTAMSALAAGLLDFAPRTRPHLGATLTSVGTSTGMATDERRGARVFATGGEALDQLGHHQQHGSPRAQDRVSRK